MKNGKKRERLQKKFITDCNAMHTPSFGLDLEKDLCACALLQTEMSRNVYLLIDFMECFHIPPEEKLFPISTYSEIVTTCVLTD